MPLRYIAEWLGASVSFDRGEGAIAIVLGAKQVRLRLGTIARGWTARSSCCRLQPWSKQEAPIYPSVLLLRHSELGWSGTQSPRLLLCTILLVGNRLP